MLKVNEINTLPNTLPYTAQLVQLNLFFKYIAVIAIPSHQAHIYSLLLAAQELSQKGG